MRLDGNPGEVIADYAENTPLDLLVMGSHGYGNLRSALMGSTAQKIAANSPCRCSSSDKHNPHD